MKELYVNLLLSALMIHYFVYNTLILSSGDVNRHLS